MRDAKLRSFESALTDVFNNGEMLMEIPGEVLRSDPSVRTLVDGGKKRNVSGAVGASVIHALGDSVAKLYSDSDADLRDIRKKQVEKLSAELEAIKKQKIKLTNLFASGDIDKEDYDDAKSANDVSKKHIE